MQKHVNLVDLVKSFPTNIYLQNLASIQKRTSPVQFAHLAEKSGKGSISNLSTKVSRPPQLRGATGGARAVLARIRQRPDPNQRIQMFRTFLLEECVRAGSAKARCLQLFSSYDSRDSFKTYGSNHRSPLQTCGNVILRCRVKRT